MVAVARPRPVLYGADNRPIHSSDDNLRERLRATVRELHTIRAKFDAAQTTSANEGHWSNADNFDPHTTASLRVRQILRSRSRYEVMENNPYLKGTVLTIANDFVGSGPKLKVTDKRLPTAVRRLIEFRWNQQYTRIIKLRQKIWRMKMAKIIDGETFGLKYSDDKLAHPVKLNIRVYECDQITSDEIFPDTTPRAYNQIDGVRFTTFEDILAYHLLRYHPGGNIMNRFLIGGQSAGQWIPAKFMIHWFRRDRGWLRGIPETTPSLPLCSLLRRYTLAVVRHAEVQADLTGIIETDGPPSTDIWGDHEDEPWETFPMDSGLMVNLPWGYKFKQVNAVPIGDLYDDFVGSILREISRPLLSTYNITIGSSNDATMSSSVVDMHIYKEGQEFERLHCNEEVLDPLYSDWWSEGIRIPDYFDDGVVGGSNFLRANPTLLQEAPVHEWTWDRIGLDHTDPDKVAKAIVTLNESGHLTDRDVQERYYNRSLEDWQEEVMADEKFNESLPSVAHERKIAEKQAEKPPAAGKSPPKRTSKK